VAPARRLDGHPRQKPPPTACKSTLRQPRPSKRAPALTTRTRRSPQAGISWTLTLQRGPQLPPQPMVRSARHRPSTLEAVPVTPLARPPPLPPSDTSSSAPTVSSTSQVGQHRYWRPPARNLPRCSRPSARRKGWT
jgi:hypothetical protein